MLGNYSKPGDDALSVIPAQAGIQKPLRHAGADRYP